MHETSKSMFRKLNDSRFATRYPRGNGIDIGAGHDGLNAYGEFFPLMKTCRTWDIDDGDAELMASVSDDALISFIPRTAWSTCETRWSHSKLAQNSKAWWPPNCHCS